MTDSYVYVHKKVFKKPGVMAIAFNPNTQESEEGGSKPGWSTWQLPDQTEPCTKTWFIKKIKKQTITE